MAEQQKQASLDELKVMLDKKAKEAEDYLSHLKRLQADFENFIKRSSKKLPTAKNIMKPPTTSIK